MDKIDLRGISSLWTSGKPCIYWRRDPVGQIRSYTDWGEIYFYVQKANVYVTLSPFSFWISSHESTGPILQNLEEVLTSILLI